MYWVCGFIAGMVGAVVYELFNQAYNFCQIPGSSLIVANCTEISLVHIGAIGLIGVGVLLWVLGIVDYSRKP